MARNESAEMDHSAAKEVKANAFSSEVRIAELEREKAETNKEMESITKRAFELEGKVVHLQHDLFLAMNGGDEAGRESERLREEVEELRRENHALSEKINEQAEELKRSSSDSGSKISELEREIEELQDEVEMELAQQKREKTEVEDAMRALEADLRKSEEKIEQMAQKWKESEEIADGGINYGGLRELKKKVQIPVAGAFSVAVVVVAVCVIRYSRTR